MRMLKKTLPILFLPLLFAGCATSFTNLTPTRQERNANNLYPVEVALDSSRQTIRWETIRPKIVLGAQSYDMHPTPLMTNRWEGFVPVPPGVEVVRYRYRFDFSLNAFGKPKPDSVVSPEYTLRVK